MPLISDKPYAKARNTIDTLTPAHYKIVETVHDHAGIYGRGGQSNGRSAHIDLQVVDTTSPVIKLHGANPEYGECGDKYVEPGWVVTDSLDTVALKKTIKGSVSPVITTLAKTGKHVLYYNAADAAGNKAATKTRTLVVADTKAPKIALKGEKHLQHTAGSPFRDQGISCSDECLSKAQLTVATKWSRKWDDTKLGDYVRTYTCSDASHTSTVTRTFTVVDKTKPVITLNGNAIEHAEATKANKVYTDKGAKCQDNIDGLISNRVKTVSNNVKMSTPGSYNIKYSCCDKSGNCAVEQSRTVVIRDTTCPKIKLVGKQNEFIEAGFPYTDAGATASDDLDGVLTSKITDDGNTVDTKKAFLAMDSCKAIKAVQVASNSFDKKHGSGYYYITRMVGPKAHMNSYKRVKVFCDMSDKAIPSYYHCKGCTRVRPYQGDQGSCGQFGLQMAKFPTKASTKVAVAQFGNSPFGCHGKSCTTDNYICATSNSYKPLTEQEKVYWAQHSEKVLSSQMTEAQKGKYVITYHVKDAAGNAECKAIKRTVVVRDTLPPVVDLKLKKKWAANAAPSNRVIQISAYKKKGIHSVKNPAGSSLQNPHLGGVVRWHNGVSTHVTNGFDAFGKNNHPTYTGKFMSEEATVDNSSYMFAASAFAVTGLALLAYGKKTEAVTVPV
jgi:hypothetical protein